MKKWKRPKFKKVSNNLYKTKYGWAVSNPKNLTLGKNTDIGFGTYINTEYGVHIGDNVQIGGGCHIYSHNSINETIGNIYIGKGAKIGAHCVILPGVWIKQNEFIKAGSIVR